MEFLKTAISALFLGAAATTAEAKPLSFSGLDETRWRNELVIYGFLPAQSTGTSTIAGTPVPLSLSLGDAIKGMDHVHGAPCHPQTQGS